MNTALAPRNGEQLAARVEDVLINGDLSKLTADERVGYYNRVCQSLGLNPLTKPFDYINLSGRLVLYAKRDATEQLRKRHGVSIEKLEKDRHDDLYVVTAYAKDRDGRTDASTGAVSLGTLKGEALANAIMKAETKAKRRVTLSICGLGMLDETEVESVPAAAPQSVVIEPEPPTEPPPDGAVYLVRIETKQQGPTLFAQVIDQTGREYVAKGSRDVTLLEQLAQDKAPVVLTTRTVKKRGTSDTYEQIVEAHRWVPSAPKAEPVEPQDGELTADDIGF